MAQLTVKTCYILTGQAHLVMTVRVQPWTTGSTEERAAKPKTSRSTSVFLDCKLLILPGTPAVLLPYARGPNENYLPGSFYRIGCNTELQKLESYCVNRKAERRYMQKEYFNMIPEVAIKTEDSDSENGCNAYGMLWRPEYAQVKTEAEYYDYCASYQRGKAVISPPINGHHKYQCAGVSRPLKCVLNKDMNHSDAPVGSQDGYAFSNDNKSCMLHDIRLTGEFRSPNLLHTIKREPDDSPPWCVDVSQGHVQQHITSNCTMNTVLHKANPYVYMQ